VKYEFIAAEKAHYSTALLCRVLKVSRSGFYAWVGRGPSRRVRADVALTARIRCIHAESRETYGSPRVHEELADEGVGVGRKRVARLMRAASLTGCTPRVFRRTTDSKHTQPVAPNVLARQFTAPAPNTVWVADITYVKTWQGWLYVAVVLDLFSRRVVGWAVDDHMRAELAIEALRMALGRRLPASGLVHHSDRGSQYASDAYRQLLADYGITCSMSRTGDCWDNAVAESFFATFKAELVYRRPWPTHLETKAAIGEYIEIFYNNQRRHSAIGYVSPAMFEKLHLASPRTAA
jgi:transposase InsO family protein